MTQTEAAAVLLNDRYNEEWYGVHGALTAIERLVAEDFPRPDGNEAKTRYQVDALRALKSELAALIDSTRSSLDSPGVGWIEEVERAGPIAHTQELITSNFSFYDLVSDLEEVFIEATRAAESMALWTGEHLAGLASPVETDEDVLIDLMLQRAPLSVESIRLKVEFVEPRFQWSNEVEIDPFDELD